MAEKNKLKQYIFSFSILLSIILAGYYTYKMVNHPVNYSPYGTL